MLSISGWWRIATQQTRSGNLLSAAWILFGLLLAVCWWVEERLPPEYPLYYSLPPGKDQLGQTNQFWLVWASLGILLLVDTLLWWIVKKWAVLQQILQWTAILSVGLLGYTLVRIYLLVV